MVKVTDCPVASTCKIYDKDCSKDYHDKAEGRCYCKIGVWPHDEIDEETT